MASQVSIVTNLLGLMVRDRETPDDSSKFEITTIYLEPDGTPSAILVGADGKFWHAPMTRLQVVSK